MTPRVYLDRYGDAPIPDGVRIIRSEVEFLKLVVDSDTGVVQGRELCRWAEEYAKGRGVEICELISPTHHLRQLCPELSLEHARELSELLRDKLAGHDEPSLPQVAQLLWGDSWWMDKPGSAHAAMWLQWWVDHRPRGAEQSLLTALGQYFAEVCNGVEREAYAVTSAEAAHRILRHWLGLDKPLSWGEFPVELTESMVRALREEFSREVIQYPEKLVTMLRAKQVDRRLLPILAQVLASYYKVHPYQLTREVFGTLERHLDNPLREELRRAIPPPVPSQPPSDPAELERWFVREYLPYREWAPDSDSEVLKIGRLFAEMYLRLYSESTLSNGPSRSYLSWVKARQLRQPDRVTLMVVLDGLGFADMKHLWGEIQRFDPSKRLVVRHAGLAFAPLPTITECAKPALLKGVKPSLAAEQQDLGKVLTKDDEVQSALAEAGLGELIIWKDPEPDRTYHDASSKEVARKKAHGVLNGFARRLTDILSRIPAGKPLQVLVTTDHGRLMAESKRLHPLPKGAQSRQRAALGDFDLRESLEILGDIAYLHRDVYGLPQDCAVILSGDSFLTQDGRQGLDAYPHGGIFPEEVLIPWWVIERDVHLREIGVQLTGKGKVGAAGNFRLKIQNPNDLAVVIEELRLETPEVLTYRLGETLPAMDKLDIELQLSSWPTSDKLKQFAALLSYRLPDGSFVEVVVRVKLEVEEMYKRDDNPLEGLL